MKKKVYEKQLSQLRPDLTTGSKGDVVKSKSKRAKSTRQENRSDRPRASASAKAAISKERVKMGGNTQFSCPQQKVGTLPKVDVLMKRRTVEPGTSVSKPSPVSTLSGIVTAESASSENINEVSAASSDPQCHPAPSPRYCIDLNNTVDTTGPTAAQHGQAEQGLPRGISSSLPDTSSISVTSTEPAISVTLAGEESHRYSTILTESVPTVSGLTVSQTFQMPEVSQVGSLARVTPAGGGSSQPVSLISSPQMLHMSGQYATEGRAHYSTHTGDYTIPPNQTISTSASHDLHTLTPLVLSESRHLDEARMASRVVNYGDLYPSHSVANWEQENNRYSDYTTSWRQHSNEGVYLSNGITHALKRPCINGNTSSVTVSAIENNNDASIPDHNIHVHDKLYPHLHSFHDPMVGDKKDSDVYSNDYTSDDSSSAKISVGGSSRRRRKRVQTPVQRSAANMRERRRMCHLNDAFNYLKEHLPNVKDKKKLSRIQTLKAAIYYIHLLRDSLKLQ